MLQFRRSLLRVGLPLALAVSFGLGAHPLANWLDFSLTLLGVALFVAAPLTAVTQALVRRGSSSLRGSVLAFVAIEGTVLIVGVAVLWIASLVPHGGWRRLPDAPTGAAVFAGPTCVADPGPNARAVYLTTRAGQVFELRLDITPASWSPVASVPAGAANDFYCRHKETHEFSTPVKLGRAVASHQVMDQGADCGGRRHYKLMPDGSVWTWSTGSCALGAVFGLFFYVVLTLFLGTVAFVSHRRRLTSAEAV